jgi:hypothetical protein
MSFLSKSISPTTRKNDLLFVVFVIETILKSITKDSDSLLNAASIAYNSLMKQLMTASTMPQSEKAAQIIQSLKHIYEIAQCVQLAKFGGQYVGTMTLSLAEINAFMATATQPLKNMATSVALNILIVAYTVTMAALVASLSLVVGPAYLAAEGIKLLASNATIREFAAEASSSALAMSGAMSRGLATGLSASMTSASKYASSASKYAAAKSKYALSAYKEALARDREHNESFSQMPRELSTVTEQEMESAYLESAYLDYGQALQLSKHFFGSKVFDSGAAYLERIWNTALSVVPTRQQLFTIASEAYRVMVQILERSPNLLAWTSYVMSYLGSFITDAEKISKEYVQQALRYSQVAYNNFVMVVQTLNREVGMQLLTFGNEIMDAFQFMTVKKSIMDAERIYSYSESFLDLASIFKDSVIEEANKMKIIIFMEAMKRLKDLRELSTIVSGKLFEVQEQLARPLARPLARTFDRSLPAAAASASAASAASAALRQSISPVASPAVASRKRLGPYGPFVSYSETMRRRDNVDQPDEPFVDCQDIFRMEPYLDFFNPGNKECRLYNDHGEYMAPKLDSGVPLIMPQELVEYLNVRTTYREFERPLLHVFAQGLKSTISLNGMKDCAEPEYQEFMKVFYTPGCSFCLREGSYSLDQEALTRFPYLDSRFPTMAADDRRAASRNNRRVRYLQDPAPMISGDESNGLQGRKYKELQAAADKDTYFQHFMFPIRDIIETEVMAKARRKGLSPLASRSRSARLYSHTQLDSTGRGTMSYYARMQNRLGQFSMMRGGRGGARHGSRHGSRRSSRRSSSRSGRHNSSRSSFYMGQFRAGHSGRSRSHSGRNQKQKRRS